MRNNRDWRGLPPLHALTEFPLNTAVFHGESSPPGPCAVGMPQPLRSLIFNTGAYIDTPANYLSPIFNILLPKNVPSRDRPESSNNQKDIYALWLASRCTAHESITPLPPGGQRAFTSRNVALACEVSKRCALDILGRLWQMHPYRISIMAGFDLLRGAFPALRGYSHALIIDEVRPAPNDARIILIVVPRCKGPCCQAT